MSYSEGSQPEVSGFKCSDGHFLLVIAKHESLADGGIVSCIPKAVGQAIAWATVIRFLISFIRYSY